MKIGIRVGVGGSVLLILADIALMFYFRKRRETSKAHPGLIARRFTGRI